MQGHREFPFGNSREFLIAKFPAGIPGNFRLFFPVISLFLQFHFHYHLQQTLSVNYNVLSIKLPTVKVKKTEIGLHV